MGVAWHNQLTYTGKIMYLVQKLETAAKKKKKSTSIWPLVISHTVPTYTGNLAFLFSINILQ